MFCIIKSKDVSKFSSYWQKKWIKSIFSSLLHSPPTFYILHTVEMRSPFTRQMCRCELGVQWKEKYGNYQRSEMFDIFWRLFNGRKKNYGCFIYSHVFYDLSYLHITHHIRSERWRLLFTHSALFSTLCHKVFHLQCIATSIIAKDVIFGTLRYIQHELKFERQLFQFLIVFLKQKVRLDDREYCCPNWLQIFWFSKVTV